MKHNHTAILFCCLLLFGSAAAQEIPKPNGYVNDFAGALDQSTKDALIAKTRQLKADKNIELGVAVVITTGGRDIAEYGTQMAREWGVGAKDGERRGLLLVVATQDRKSNIQVSRHLEGDFTDARTGAMLRAGRDDFKAGNFGGGIIKITDALIARADSVGAEDKADTPAEANKGWNIGVLYLFLAVVGFGAVGLLYPVVRELLSLRKKPQSVLSTSDAPLHDASNRPTPAGASSGVRGKKRKRKGSRKSASDDASLAAGYMTGAERESSSSTSSSPTSDHSSSSNSHDSSSSHSSSSFGGGSDFGGGGASDSW